jgi:large subunit ribosomal protein L21
MTMTLAIIKTGGKQYLVKKGDKIKVEKLSTEEGDKTTFETLITMDETGENIKIGKPVLDSKVEAKVLKQARADKVKVIKYKAKTRYHRNVGHRQAYSLVQIEKI